MKVKSIKINNFKSFENENNTLILDDINTIIGKNESGKSNMIECLSAIDFNGIKDTSFFKKVNKNSSISPTVSIVLIPYSFETGIKGETIITIDNQYDFKIKGGYSEMISKDEEFQNNRTKLNELNKGVINLFSNQLGKNYQDLIKMINEAEHQLFIKYSYIESILQKLHLYEVHKELCNYLEKCIDYLSFTKNYLPKFLEIKDDILNSRYTRKDLIDTSIKKTMFFHLLKCINYDLDTVLDYWKKNSSDDKENFEIEFNEALKDFSERFNEFYDQDNVLLKARFNDDSIEFMIKSSNKYINFDERSNGLKWYLCLFTQIFSRTNNSKVTNYCLLLDEPGVHLHVNAQKELLKLFENISTENNQLIYTTHLPTMIYGDKLYRTKYIIKDEKENSIIGNKYYSIPHKMKGKLDTITPLLKSIGMNMNSYFLSFNDKINLIVEGISDCYYIKGYLKIKGISNFNIIPSSGVSNIHNIVSILIGWNCPFKVILDQDKAGRREYDVLCKSGLIKTNDVIFVNSTNIEDKSINFTIEEIFSKEDKEIIGINNKDYLKEKAYYSLETLKKIENHEFVYDELTLKNFDSLFEKVNL